VFARRGQAKVKANMETFQAEETGPPALCAPIPSRRLDTTPVFDYPAA
jgi:hypothetical protein